ncbi:Peptide-N4-N-acetyl-beta-glucosaminylasparagine amidase [Hondaea fermentalgiana]|uniref:Peptide-N4-N-acetyl-beta-glucosaminylasparagine amidase n=1 Tax=Hondaea fermentalgiana TaxID=2315210 RepID=A0A2R5GIU8_9STRA|nr:Peptide-N4-N-acetyl-beta-glucosaminylasparagine amidase [Hondaea fermentalgiana]|eukprot:GBG29648.1 Peptide-N4-N-acetyl-beta-glucosaminylasparagine amidase [Hondaea fermentalgiana]
MAAKLGLQQTPPAESDESAGQTTQWALGWAQRLGAEDRDRLLMELMRWFKHDFFKWAGKLPCPGCESDDTHCLRGTEPLDHERADLAGRVEIHECKACGAEFRFPRYNCPGKLLETRLGRCGEWANCFGLLLRALGFEARYVLDWTDHVWCEVWSDRVSRWVHCDCCEGPGTIDSPLMYEAGWGKKLNYIVAFAPDHVVDVTRRYTQDFEALKPRRNAASETVIETLIFDAHRQAARTATSSDATVTRTRLLMEQFSFMDAANRDLKDAEQQGRVSGEAEWKRLRGEDGAGAAS